MAQHDGGGTSAGAEGAFKPQEHMRNLKGQMYLEVKWRVLWFREEHDDGYIQTDLVEHDADAGRAVFKARAGFYRVIGEDVNGYPAYREVYATSYGSETRADFADYVEKAETKAVGRALALLGYGTAAALDLDEGAAVDAPVEGTHARARGQTARDATQGASAAHGATGGQSAGTARTPLAVVPAAATVDELIGAVCAGLAQDAEAASKIPKSPQEMTEAELTKTLTWLTRRARALSS